MPVLSRLKYAVLILVVILMAASLGACARQEPTPTATATVDETPTPTQVAQEPVTVTWSFWGDPWEVEVNERVITVFEADYPQIKVETLHEPWTTYFDKVEEWWGSDAPPDVMFLEFIPIYAARGLLKTWTPISNEITTTSLISTRASSIASPTKVRSMDSLAITTPRSSSTTRPSSKKRGCPIPFPGGPGRTCDKQRSG